MLTLQYSELAHLYVFKGGSIAVRIELDRGVRCGWEDKVGHRDAPTIDKDFNRTLVNKDVQVVGVGVAKAQWCPCTECKVILIINGVHLALLT